MAALATTAVVVAGVTAGVVAGNRVGPCDPVGDAQCDRESSA